MGIVWGDGLSVVETVFGIDYEPRLEGCRRGVVKPGPCPGTRNAGPKLLPRRAVAKKKAPPKATPDAIAARKKQVEQAVQAALKTLATHKTHTRDPGGSWRPDRDAVHREIVDAMFAKAADVPNDGRAVIAGGLGGAGKSTVLRDHAGIDPKQYLTINPDDIKEELARRDLIPHIPGAENLSPMERAALVHEESSRIAHMLADRAYREKKNVIWDITMSSGSSVQSRVEALKNKGYTDIQGVFVDIPTEVSVKRALSRYERGLKAWQDGKGYGGRYVPPSIIRAQETSTGRTVNRDVFDTLKQTFDAWAIFDNSVDGRPPQLVDRKDS